MESLALSNAIHTHTLHKNIVSYCLIAMRTNPMPSAPQKYSSSVTYTRTSFKLSQQVKFNIYHKC